MASIFTHLWIVNRTSSAKIQAALRQHAHGVCLDLGCGLKPFESLIRTQVTQYVAMDIEPRSKIHVLGDALSLPFRPSSFDTLLCSEVLEHLDNPIVALREMHNALKPSGSLILSTPFLYPVHEAPRDYLRFTRFGLRTFLAQSGFDVVSIDSSGGYWVTLCLLIVLYLEKVYSIPLLKYAAMGAVGLLQPLFLFLDRLNPLDRFAYDHVVVARRNSQILVSESR